MSHLGRSLYHRCLAPSPLSFPTRRFSERKGGDFCGYGATWSDWVEDCRQRSHTPLGSTRHLRPDDRLDLYAQGIDAFANDPAALGFDWNWVLVLYCDGHYYAGANMSTTLAPVPGRPPRTTEPLFFRGAFNVEVQ